MFGPEGEQGGSIIKAALSIAEICVFLSRFTMDSSQFLQTPWWKLPLSEETTTYLLEDGVPNISLCSVHAVITHLPAVEAARAKVTAEMENMVVRGLQYLVMLLILASNLADELI